MTAPAPAVMLASAIVTPRHDEPLRPGSHLWSWCRRHGVRTEHLYDGHRLICLECHPEEKKHETA